MGPEFLDYLREIIGETVFLAQDQEEEKYEELNSKYEILQEQYEALKDQYEDLKYERGCW